MSTRQERGRRVETRRGRQVQPQRSPFRTLYFALGAIALVAVALVAVILTNRDGTGGPLPVRPLTAPTGVTADGFYYKGNPDAPVKVIEYADYQCPACGYFFQQMENDLDEQFVESGQVQFIYHEFPLPQHQNAIPTAKAARCAGEQDQFWAMHDVLFSRQRDWSNAANVTPRLQGYARELGLDQGAFDQCFNSDETQTAIEAARTAAEQKGVSSTPTFEVEGQLVNSNDVFRTIQSALAAKGQ